MTPLLFLGVAVAGGAGAALRYLVDLAVARMRGSRLPWGTLIVNVTGSFALGLVSSGLVDATGVWMLGGGLLGGYTTFSAVSVSTALLASERRWRGAAGYATMTFLGSLAAALAGLGLGALLG